MTEERQEIMLELMARLARLESSQTCKACTKHDCSRCDKLHKPLASACRGNNGESRKFSLERGKSSDRPNRKNQGIPRVFSHD